MRIVIVGGGKLAYYLIKTLRPYRHQISVIELQKEVSARIATDFDEVDVYNGDGTSIRMMNEVGCQDADFTLLLPARMKTTWSAARSPKRNSKSGIRFPRVNNPKNAEMFSRMGVDKVYSGTQILADIIEQEVDFEGLRVVLKIERSNKSIIEFKLSARSVACGKPSKLMTSLATARLS